MFSTLGIKVYITLMALNYPILPYMEMDENNVKYMKTNIICYIENHVFPCKIHESS